MTILVLLFGVLIAAIGLYGLAQPMGLIDQLQKLWATGAGLITAVLVRLAMGVLLLLTAPEALHPHVFQVLGLIAIVAAVALPFVGNERLGRMIAWWGDQSPALIRVQGAVAFGFGAYMVYAIA
jgi:hypothetical protein